MRALVTPSSFCEQHSCHDGGLLPYMIRIACSFSNRLMAALFGAAATAGAADSSTPVGVSSPSLHTTITTAVSFAKWARRYQRARMPAFVASLSTHSTCACVVSILHVLRQFHRLHSEQGQMIHATAINAVPVLEDVCAGTTQEWSLRLDLTQDGKTHQVLTCWKN